jgi:hypothetical protein
MKIQVGAWIVDTDSLDAREASDYDEYPVALEELRTCGEILNELTRVLRIYDSPAAVGDLFKIFDVAYSLQGNLRGCGDRERLTLSAAQMRHNLIEFEVDRRCQPDAAPYQLRLASEYLAHRDRVRRELGLSEEHDDAWRNARAAEFEARWRKCGGMKDVTE